MQNYYYKYFNNDEVPNQLEISWTSWGMYCITCLSLVFGLYMSAHAKHGLRLQYINELILLFIIIMTKCTICKPIPVPIT